MVHQPEIVIDYVSEDDIVPGRELGVNDRIVLEGIRQVRDGEKLESRFFPPKPVLANQEPRGKVATLRSTGLSNAPGVTSGAVQMPRNRTTSRPTTSNHGGMDLPGVRLRRAS